MTSEEAKEIVGTSGGGLNWIAVPADARQLGTAEGYLLGMRDPAVLAMVEAIKVQLEASGSCTGGCCLKARNALAAYREATQ